MGARGRRLKEYKYRRRKYCEYHRRIIIRENAQKGSELVKEKFLKDSEYQKKALENLQKGRVTGIKRPRSNKL